MAAPFPLQASFTGMMQDSPRDRLPQGALWNCVDWIPEYLGSPLRKRGGWTYASLALGAATYVDGVVYAPFASGEKNVAVGQDGNAYSFTTGGTTNLGVAFAVAQNPVIHRTGAPTLTTVVIPAASGSTAPKSWDGVTYGNLGGTPPLAKYAAVWNDRTLLANGTVGATLFPQRMWFSPIGNAAATWDTTNSYQDSALPITGLGVLKTAILMFHAKSTERVRGTVSPSATTIGDLQQDQAFSVGCIDARSIVNYNETLIWADVRGVYQTDGAALKDLTRAGGMSGYWRAILASYATGYTVAGGVYADTYIVSVMNGTNFIDCLAYDLNRGFWYRLGNFGARCFARQGSTFEETYMGLGTAGRVAALSTILSPSSTVKADGDGTAVAPYFETGLYRGYQHVHRSWRPSLSMQDWKTLYLNYDLRDGATDNPTITVSYAVDPGASSYTALSYTLAETLKYSRVKRPLGFNGLGLMLKVAQTGPSADTRFTGLECEYSPREGSRLQQ